METRKKNKYPVLSTVSTILQFAGVIGIIFAIINAVYLILEKSNSEGMQLFFVFKDIFTAFIFPLLLITFSELINLFIDMEYNTRKE